MRKFYLLPNLVRRKVTRLAISAGVICSCRFAGIRETSDVVIVLMSFLSMTSVLPSGRLRVRLVADSLARTPA